MELLQDVKGWEKIIKNSLDVIGTIDKNGVIVNVNEACKSIFGYESSEMIGCRFVNFIHPDDLTLSLDALQDAVRGNMVKNFENRYIHKSGKEVTISWSGAWSPEDEVILCVGRDITEQKKAEEKSVLYEALIKYGSDIVSAFDKDLNYLFSGPSSFKELGYLPEQLIGTCGFDYVHPDDIPLIKESLSKGLASGEEVIKIPEFRFKDAKGDWRWIETKASNQLNNPAVKALLTSSRDITERVNDRFKLQERKQRFKSLFDNHLDLVFFQNKEGMIVDVNPAALSFYGMQRQDLLNQQVSDFLPPQVIPVSERSFQDALNGKSVRFEITTPFNGKGLFTFDVVKVPVIVDGETIGVYSILRDITEISQSNSIITKQAKKINTSMGIITDAFLTLDKNWNFTYVNSAFERIYQKDRKEILGKSIWDLYRDEVNGEFYRQYHYAMETGKAVDFEAHFNELDMWLQVKAFPSEEGLSIFLNDITERIKSRQELEKLSLVASKTTNGVVITNSNALIEWVNEGFSNLTGYTLSEVKGKSPASFLIGEETDKDTVDRFLKKRLQPIPIHEEMLNYKKSGEKIWLSLDITPVLNEVGEVTRFISIQTDITDRKEAEKNQLQLTKDLYTQNRDLQQFTYIVSHNLRSPVATAMGFVDLLASTDNSSADFDISLNYLKGSISKMDIVLKDLNTILSVRDKKDNIEKERVKLAPIFQQVIEEQQEPLKKCGGEVSLDMEEGLSVHGNKAYLYSIFYNLLSNTLKFRCPERTLKVEIQCVSSKDKGTVISFADNGLGFDMNLAGDKVFQLYKRFHSNSEGRGMGLFLVKTHLEAMGGHIEVTSQVNLGTRFLIYLK